MLSLNLANTVVLMTKFFGANDSQNVLRVIEESNPKKVLFIDTPATPFLVETISGLLKDGVDVHVRDHHNVINPTNERQKEIALSAQQIIDLVGASAIISDRETNPACSSLIQTGEFLGEATIIIADPDLDGLLASMKALGLIYPGLDEDANILDGPRSGQSAEVLTEVSWLLVRAMATLPMFDVSRPEISEKVKAELFETFARATQGDENAKSQLESKISAYEQGVKNAQILIDEHSSEEQPGVFVVDATKSERYDLATLTQAFEKKAKVLVIKKADGPIAKIFGVQYSLSVITSHQKEVDLQKFLPEGFRSAPDEGIISNTTFLLHVNEERWAEFVLPHLRARFLY